MRMSDWIAYVCSSHRRRAEPGDIGQFVGQPRQVAAMIETAVGRVVTGRQPIARKPAAIVRGIAVGEAIGKDEIDHLVLRQPLAIGRTIVRRGRARHGGGEQQPAKDRSNRQDVPPRFRSPPSRGWPMTPVLKARASESKPPAYVFTGIFTRRFPLAARAEDRKSTRLNSSH